MYPYFGQTDRCVMSPPVTQPKDRTLMQQWSGHNGVPRTFRDKRECCAIRQEPREGDIIELRDCATGEKLVMLVDGRVG